LGVLAPRVVPGLGEAMPAEMKVLALGAEVEGLGTAMKAAVSVTEMEKVSGMEAEARALVPEPHLLSVGETEAVAAIGWEEAPERASRETTIINSGFQGAPCGFDWHA